MAHGHDDGERAAGVSPVTVAGVVVVGPNRAESGPVVGRFSTSISVSFAVMGGDFSITAGGNYWVTADSRRREQAREAGVDGALIEVTRPLAAASRSVASRASASAVMTISGIRVEIAAGSDPAWAAALIRALAR